MFLVSKLRSLATKAYRWVAATITQSFSEAILKAMLAGPMPRHVAFIMDGNRRYARMHNIPTSQGHSDGYYQLSYLMGEWLNKTDIACVSIYGWSILNFGRKEEEVAASMKLMEEKLEEFISSKLLERNGVRVSIFGRTELFSERIQELISRVEEKTSMNGQHSRFMNIYLSYTSGDEMARSVEACVNASLESAKGLPITAQDMEMHLDGAFLGEGVSMPPVDILVRTSGAKRFSDFLLWQACDRTQVQFVPTLWPVFGRWDLLFIFLDYQRSKLYR